MKYNDARRTRFLSLLLVLSLVWGWQIWHPASEALAASCRNAGAKSKTLAVGSQVDGDLVTICLNKTLQKKLLLVTKPSPKPILKAVPKPTSKPAPKPAVKRPKKLAPKPAPKPIIKRKKSTSNNNSRAVFRPKAPLVTVAPGGTLKILQVAKFTAAPKVLFGRSQLLGNPVLVRFTPKTLEWSFGDGSKSLGSSAQVKTLSHGYSKAGIYVALLHTTFTVSYRLASGSWLADPDTITLVSSPLNLRVGIAPAKSPAKSVLVTSG